MLATASGWIYERPALQALPIAVEALPVIGAAMAEAEVVGLGHLTLSRRERMVMVEPSGIGMALFTLRAASDVRAPQFGSAEGDLDAEMVAIAGAIIGQRIEITLIMPCRPPR